jgi:hypothetical protein
MEGTEPTADRAPEPTPDGTIEGTSNEASAQGKGGGRVNRSGKGDQNPKGDWDGKRPGTRQAARSRFTPGAMAGLRLEERDELLLCDLYLHRFMSRSQVEALFFSSTVRANARLRQLFDHGFVRRYYLPAAPYGAQAIYSIGKKAVPLVARRLEVEADEVARHYRGTKSPTFIEHTLEVVNIRLAFRDACTKQSPVSPHVAIERWLPEMECRHEYQIRAKGTGHWKKEAFKPDAFVRLAAGKEFFNFFIEVDLGHTSSRQFAGKLSTHQRYLESGLFQEIYSGDEFHTLVITTGQRRLKNLGALARQHFAHEHTGQQHNDHLFWFTTFDEAKATGILGTIWHKGIARREPLLPSFP